MTTDLTTGAPRSPYDEVGGITFLPRSIDKMRASLAGSAGAYNAKTGYSTNLFELFGVTADEFEQIVRDNPTDEGVLQALTARKPLSGAEIEAWNRRSINREPADDAGLGPPLEAAGGRRLRRPQGRPHHVRPPRPGRRP